MHFININFISFKNVTLFNDHFYEKKLDIWHFLLFIFNPWMQNTTEKNWRENKKIASM